MSSNNHNNNSNNNNNPNEVFAGGATTSQHIDAEDDDHFNNTTFKLKRTRSIGLLDEFISPLERAKREAEQLQSLQQHDDESEISHHETVDSNNDKLPVDTSGSSSPNDYNNDDNDNNNNNKNDANTNNISNDYDNSNNNNDDDQNELNKVISPTSFISPEFIPHDDADIEIEPSRHVDYLSHQWDVSDISKSWRYVIQKRRDVADSARLENASWRTWAQRRSNLKTINPEELNWSKENDITWLYGPIIKDDPESDDDDVDNPHHHHEHKSNTASSAVAGDISIPNKPIKNKKGILKKRSVQDEIISHSNLVKLEAMENRLKAKKEKQQEQLKRYYQTHRRTPSNEPPEFNDFDAISDKLNTQYRIPSNQNSAIDLSSLSNPKNDTRSPSVSTDDATNVSNLDLTKNPNDSNNQLSDSKSVNSTLKKDRHIHFSDEVQQCIAVDVMDDDEFDSDVGSDVDDDEQDYGDNISSSSATNSYMFSNPHNTEDSTAGDDEGDDEDGDDEDEDDDDDDDGGFFLKVRSPTGTNAVPPLVNKEKRRQELEQSQNQQDFEQTPSSQKTDDSDSISTNSSKIYRTIQLLPSTNLNYGSDDESSDEENPYTSSLSHNVNNSSSRGYDYYYDYNTVYTVDPAHGIYGGNKDDGNSPDVVDLPQDLAKYSNFENISEGDNANEGNSAPPIMDSQVISNNNYIYNSDNNFERGEGGSGSDSNSNSNNNSPGVQSPLFSARPQLDKKSEDTGLSSSNQESNSNNEGSRRVSTFDLNDSDSNSDSDDGDEGLSISARSSSQSLAELVFNHGAMTPMTKNDDKNGSGTSSSHPGSYNPTPINENISSINPSHSSTGLSKQDTSSNSLSSQFFGTTPLSKDRESSTSLADQFFNKQPTKIASPPVDKKSTQSIIGSDSTNEGSSGRSSSPKTGSLRQLAQSKSSPLPPHTTSANAFLGNITPPLEKQQKSNYSSGGVFSLGVSDSDTDSDSESDENHLIGDVNSPLVDQNVNQNVNCYSSLSQVAGRNGISPSPQAEDMNLENDQIESPDISADIIDHNQNNQNIVNQAKGLATHLLGNWKSHEQS